MKSACFWHQAYPSETPVRSGTSLPFDPKMMDGWLQSRLTIDSVSRCHQSSK
jgi:hypothetical protein